LKAHTLEFLGTMIGTGILAILTAVLYLRLNDPNVLLIGAGIFTALAVIVALR